MEILALAANLCEEHATAHRALIDSNSLQVAVLHSKGICFAVARLLGVAFTATRYAKGVMDGLAFQDASCSVCKGCS